MNPYRLDMDSPPYQTAASIPNLAAIRGTEQAEKIEVQLLPQVIYVTALLPVKEFLFVERCESCLVSSIGMSLYTLLDW